SAQIADFRIAIECLLSVAVVTSPDDGRGRGVSRGRGHCRPMMSRRFHRLCRHPQRWPPLGQPGGHLCPCFAAPSHADAPRLIATSVPLTNNGLTSMSIPKNVNLSAWQLPSLLIPVHQYKKTSIHNP